jgi:hypothetical protein
MVSVRRFLKRKLRGNLLCKLVIVLLVGVSQFMFWKMVAGILKPVKTIELEYLTPLTDVNLTKQLEKLPLATFQFDPRHHWLVLLHIQKTGGTDFDCDFMRNSLIKHNNSAQKLTHDKYKSLCQLHKVKLVKTTNRGHNFTVYKFINTCFRPGSKTNESFYLSWHTNFGWSCGLHPDLSDLRDCVFRMFAPLDHSHRSAVRDKRFFFMTLIREARTRFYSEFCRFFFFYNYFRKLLF